MRVAVIFFEGKSQNRKKTLAIAKGVSAGIEEHGHQVDMVDGNRDVNTKLTIYQYIVVGASAMNTFGGKISESVTRFLGSSGVITGKRSFAYIVKSGFRATKTLSVLMNAMEHEGMYLKYSEILSSAEEAKAIGARLHID